MSTETLLTRRSLATFGLLTMAGVGASTPAQATGGLIWHPLKLINGWSSYYRAPAIAADPATKLIYLRGSIQQTSGTDHHAFSVAPIYRPGTYTYLVATNINVTTGRIRIDPTGQVMIEGDPQSNAQGFTSLEGLYYTR
ncbi:MAG: hypothetical protein ACRECC_06955 [Pseudolabrys sp.]